MKKYLFSFFLFISALFGSPQQSFWETYTAALRGDSEAQFLVGVIYSEGINVEQNLTSAAKWYEKSAKQGHVDAAFNLAIMYAEGRGVQADETKAMMWLERAAYLGDNEAHNLLVRMLDDKLKAKNSSVKNHRSDGEQKSDFGQCTEIEPITLYAKEGGEVCDKNQQCRAYKQKAIYTSTIKCGDFYKISGTVDKKGWKEFGEEGWINERSVEKRR